MIETKFEHLDCFFELRLVLIVNFAGAKVYNSNSSKWGEAD